MACRDCGHWHPSYIDGQHPERADCTLNPVWVETRREHFCSHESSYVTKRTPEQQNLVHANYENTLRFERKQQDRAIKAEKALKLARAALRRKTL